MNKAIYAATTALAVLAMTPGAHAADMITNGIDLSSQDSDSFSAAVDSTAPSGASFALTFDFTVPYDAFMALQVSSTALFGDGKTFDVDFSSIKFDGTPVSFVNDTTPVPGAAPTDYAALGPVSISSLVTHHLYVAGTVVGHGTFVGNINIAPIPEPASWALMVTGITAVGLAMRSKSRNVRISFS